MYIYICISLVGHYCRIRMFTYLLVTTMTVVYISYRSYLLIINLHVAYIRVCLYNMY